MSRKVITGHTLRHYTENNKYRLIWMLLLGDVMVWLWAVLRWNLPETRRCKCMGQMVKYVSGYRRSGKTCYKCVRSWIMELKEELYNIGLAFVCRK